MIVQANTEPMTLTLTVTDVECVGELSSRQAGDERDFFALSALRVGVLALRQAAGVVDRQAIRSEGDRLIDTLRNALQSHYERTTDNIGTVLEKYFDANDGSLLQRLDRLVKKDGDLESLLSRYMDGDTSTLSKSLDQHLGVDSPLLQTLSTDRSKGLLAALNEVITDSVRSRNESIIQEFTLDNKDSALARLVSRITDENGQLRKEFSEDVLQLRQEFSLDNEEGSLCRLVRQVEQSRRAIVAEFSPDNETSILSKIGKLLEATNDSIRGSLTLDDDGSPLSRLKRELVDSVDELSKKNSEFHTEVREALSAITARRSEAKRSTRHGDDFHDAVGAFVDNESRRLNDVCELTGEMSGAISRCKKGDAVVTLGPESSAPDVRIVYEAKGDKSYTLKKSLDELAVARENREANVGVFVFDRDAAPEGLEVLTRFGSDIVVIWDAEDPSTDVNLRAAHSIARYIAVEKTKTDAEKTGDRLVIESAVQMISRNVDSLSDIQRLATTVKNNGEKIISKASKLEAVVRDQLGEIEQHVSTL